MHFVPTEGGSVSVGEIIGGRVLKVSSAQLDFNPNSSGFLFPGVHQVQGIA